MSEIKLNATTALPLRYLNRHMLISGQTGTGKTSTLMTLCERLTAQDVPVFIVDAKGDLGPLRHTVADCRRYQPFQMGAAVWDMGPDLISRALELSPAQSGAIDMAFDFANTHGKSLLTLSDLQNAVSQAGAFDQVGLITKASSGVVYRSALRLKNSFVGQPTFDVANLLQSGRLSVLAASRMISTPRAYSALILFLLEQLYSRLPEVGDMDKPRLVFVIDEAHLIFRDLPERMLLQLEQTARLIRSKGVALAFSSQSAQDVPAVIRDQCSHRITHDRAHGVGRADVVTMTGTGMPRPLGVVSIDRPDCAGLSNLPVQDREAFQAPVIPRARATPCAVNVTDGSDVLGVTLIMGIVFLMIVGLNALTFQLSPGALIAVCVGFAVAAFMGLRK